MVARLFMRCIAATDRVAFFDKTQQLGFFSFGTVLCYLCNLIYVDLTKIFLAVSIMFCVNYLWLHLTGMFQFFENVFIWDKNVA